MERNLNKAGWRPGEFFPLCGFSRSAGYALPPEMQPRSVKIGSARIINEAPADYLARLAKMQAEAAAKTAAGGGQ